MALGSGDERLFLCWAGCYITKWGAFRHLVDLAQPDHAVSRGHFPPNRRLPARLPP